jgi:hypothetical protein
MSDDDHNLSPWLATTDPGCDPHLKSMKVVIHHQVTDLHHMATAVKALLVAMPHPLLVSSVKATSVLNAHQRSLRHRRPSLDPPLITKQCRTVVDCLFRPRQTLIIPNLHHILLLITVPPHQPPSRLTPVPLQALRALCFLITGESLRARWITEGAPGTPPQIHILLPGLPQVA